MRISSRTTLLEMALIVGEALEKAGVDAFLSGGAVVTIYTKNKYMSYDLDFVAYADFRKLTAVMESLGFKREKSRHFVHPDSKFFVEFPGLAATVGDSPIEEFAEKRSKAGSVKLLTPTYCVMDRLAAYFHWNDHQSLEQAVAVATDHPIQLERVRAWSKREGMLEKFNDFIEHLNPKKDQ